MRKMLLASAAMAVAMVAMEAQAQTAPAPATPEAATTEPTVVGEVLISARRRSERLKDVPAAASVIDEEALLARGGVSDPEKLLAGIPGVRYLNTSSPTTAETSVRASGTSRGTFAESGIGLYRDGVYVGGGLLGGRNFARIDLFDVQRAEVVRGTQSALYGRNAVGGAINIISQKPKFETGGFIDLKYGVNNENAMVQGVYNHKVNDNFAIRLGGQYFDQEGGFFYNATRDEYFDHEEGNIVRGQMRFTSESLEVNFLLENQVASLPALNWQLDIPPQAAFPVGFTEQKQTYHWNSPSRAKQQITGAVLSVNYDFGWGELVSVSASRIRYTQNAFDGDGVDPPTLAAIRATGGGLTVDVNTAQQSNDRVETLYQDLHLLGNKINGFDWMVGFELLRVKDDYRQYNTRTPTLAQPTTGTRQPARMQIDSRALYGTLNYDVTPAFNVGAELRFASDSKDFYTERFDLRTNTSSGARFRIDDTLESENVSYNLIASYRLPFDWLAYGKVGTAYRTGGYNRDLGDPRAPTPVIAGFGDEQSTTYEVGFKGNIGRNIYVELAGYQTMTEDLLVQLDNGCRITNPTCPVAATSFMVNAGEGEAWGIEGVIDGRFQVGAGDLRVSLGASRQEGEIVSGAFQGSTMPQVPDWVTSASVNFRHPFVGASTVAFNLAYRGQRGGVQEIAGTPLLSEYDVIDARVVFDFGGWQVAAFADNATNEMYVNFASATNKRWSQPRLYGLQFRKAW